MTSKELILQFSNLYRQTVGEPFSISWGRDTKLIQELINTFGSSTIEQALPLYFNSNERIYAIPFFKVRINELVQQLKKDKPKEVKSLQNPDINRFL